MPRKLQALDDRPSPDIQPLEVVTTKGREASQSYRLRTTGPSRTSEPWRPQHPKELRPANATAAGRPTRTGRPTAPRLQMTDATPTEGN